MEVAGLPVRRSAKYATSTNCEYWDDEAWVDLDPYAQCLIQSALIVGRDITTIYIGATAYDISLQSGNQMQINRITGKARPLRISGMASVVQGAEEDEDEDEDDDEDVGDDDPSVPPEFRCPITHMVMKKPVMATDGHSYELKAMQKWLLKKQTSP
eukprot:7046952-Prymnesium_polylepis.3